MIWRHVTAIAEQRGYNTESDGTKEENARYHPQEDISTPMRNQQKRFVDLPPCMRRHRVSRQASAATATATRNTHRPTSAQE